MLLSTELIPPVLLHITRRFDWTWSGWAIFSLRIDSYFVKILLDIKWGINILLLLSNVLIPPELLYYIMTFCYSIFFFILHDIYIVNVLLSLAQGHKLFSSSFCLLKWFGRISVKYYPYVLNSSTWWIPPSWYA